MNFIIRQFNNAKRYVLTATTSEQRLQDKDNARIRGFHGAPKSTADSWLFSL